MSKLLIVESPAKCKKIESFLGGDYTCLASFGHIRQLTSLKNIDFNDYSIQFENIFEKNAKIKSLKSAMKKSTEVIIATDDDREGEAIGWHLCQVLNLDVKTTKRIIFHEVTKNAIIKAISNPTTIDMNVVHAQNARQILDLVIGFKFSPVLWEQINRTKGLSAGRCQTPALKVVYENQKEIDGQTYEQVYNTIAYMTSKNIPFELNHNFKEQPKVEDFLEESANFDHILTNSEAKIVSKSPPQPLITSTLQQQASNQYHWGPKETMSIAQKLYENGYITYMRTDSKTYSIDFIETTKTYICDNYGDKYVKDKIYLLSSGTKEDTKSKSKSKKSKEKEKKVEAQEAHEAIRPTNISCLKIDAKFTNKEKNLYNLIWSNTIKSCMADATFQKYKSSVTAPQELMYHYSPELCVFKGWKIIDDKNEDDPYYQYLILLNNQTINFNKITSKVTIKNLKSHLTEAKLISLLEEKGIGRPSTFSSIIEKNKERGYFEKKNVEGVTIECVNLELENDTISESTENKTFGKENNKLVIQPLGIMVIELLNKYFDSVFDYDYTQNMENKLDNISKNIEPFVDVCNDFNDNITSMLSLYKQQCPKKKSMVIDEHHEYVIGKFGPVIKCVINGETTWKQIKKGITFEDIEEKGLSLEDILDNSTTNRILGTHKDIEVILKKGKYGYYVSYGENNFPTKSIDKSPNNINLADVIDIISNNSNPNVVRTINEDSSIRKGKFGNYLFYKTASMKKPKFINLKTFKHNPINCDVELLTDFIKNNI